MSNARPPQATYLGDEHVIDVLANPWGEPLVASTATTAFSLGVSDLEAVAPPQPFQSPAFNPYMASHAMQPLAPPSSLAAEAAPWPSTPPQAQVMFDTLPFRPSTAPKGRASGCASWCRLAPLSSNQRSTLLIIGLQLLISLLAWSVFSVGVYLLYPFQLISVLFHELGHATMAWLTGGRVQSIQVGAHADGLTKYYGGCQCLVLPAGYLGSVFMGAVMLFCGFSFRASLFLSYFLDLVLLFIIFFAETAFTVIITIFTLLIFLSLAYLGQAAPKAHHPGHSMAWWKDSRHWLRFCVLFMGVVASFLSLFDILDDLVFRSVPESDGYRFASHCLYFIPSVIVGLFWMLLGLALVGLAILLALKLLHGPS